MSGGTWGNEPAARYAAVLRWKADRADLAADRRRGSRDPWAPGDVEKHERSARRLRAMARLCDAAPDGTRARDVDFRGLTRPDLGHIVEDRIVAEIESETGGTKP